MRHSVSTTAEVLGLVVAFFGTVLDRVVEDPGVRSGCISWLREILNACIVVCPRILGGESFDAEFSFQVGSEGESESEKVSKKWLANVA